MANTFTFAKQNYRPGDPLVLVPAAGAQGTYHVDVVVLDVAYDRGSGGYRYQGEAKKKAGAPGGSGFPLPIKPLKLFTLMHLGDLYHSKGRVQQQPPNETKPTFFEGLDKFKKLQGGPIPLGWGFDVTVCGGKITSASTCKLAFIVRQANEEAKKRRGFFDGQWGEVPLTHDKGSDEIEGLFGIDPVTQFCKARYGKLKGKVVPHKGGKKILELRWTREGNLKRADDPKREGGVRLELVNQDTLRGAWWYDDDLEKETYDDIKGWVSRLWYLKRIPEKDFHLYDGLAIPIRFQGWSSFPMKTSIPWPLVEHKFQIAYAGKRVSDSGESVDLQLGIGFRRPADGLQGLVCDRHYYVPYPLSYDYKLQATLAKAVLHQRTWLLGAKLLKQSKALMAELQDLGRVLCPGKKEYWKHDPWKKVANTGFKQGEKDQQKVRESLVLRFASSGLTPADPNPFPKGSTRGIEFECYRTMTTLVDRDRFVELYEHPVADKRFPGRTWTYAENDRESSPGAHYSAHLFPDDTVSAVRVPEGFEVTLFADPEHRWQGPSKTLTKGLHDLSALGWNDRIRSVRVRRKTVDPKVEKDARVQAYRRGRQLRRVMHEGALAETRRVPSRLITLGTLAGLAVDDVEHGFIAAWATEGRTRRRNLVKTLASLGFGAKSRNPFGKAKGKKRERDEFVRFQKLLKDPKYKKAYQEGQAIYKIFQHGDKVGRGVRGVSKDLHLIHLQAHLGGISEEAGERVYENGYGVGRHKKEVRDTELWFHDTKNQKEFAKVIGEVVKLLVRYGWEGRWKRADQDKFFHQPWHNIKQTKALCDQAIDAGVPERVFDEAVAATLKRTLPKAQASYDHRWRHAIEKTVLNIGEWLGAALYAVLDTITWPICKIAGWQTYQLSTHFVDQCRTGFEDSAFRAITADTTMWQAYGMAVLGLGNAFLTVGLCMTGAGGLRNLGNFTKAGMSMRTALQTALIGGAEWTGTNVLRAVLQNVVLSTALGFAEEGIESGILDKSFSFSDALCKTLRNSAMFLGFEGATNLLTVVEMGESFAALMFLPQLTGVLATGCELMSTKADDPKDEAARKRAWLSLANEAFSTLLMMGLPGVRKVLFEKFRATKVGNAVLERYPKLDTFLKETPVQLPTEKPEDVFRFTLFHRNDPKAIQKYVESRGSWSRIEGELQGALPKTKSGELRAGSREILQKTFLEFLRVSCEDQKGMKAFAKEVKDWSKLEALEALLPRDRHGVVTPRVRKLWNQARLRILTQALPDHPKMRALFEHVSEQGGWAEVKGIRDWLPKTEKGTLTEASEQLWGKLSCRYLETYEADSTRILGFFHEEAPTFHHLEGIERRLPRDEYGLLTPEAEKAWGKALLHYLKERTGTEEKSLAFYKEIGGWDRFLRPIGEKLPHTAKRELTPEAKKVWDQVHQARTQFCEEAYRAVYESMKKEYGVELLKPGKDQKYFIGTAPHKKGEFKGVNSDLDFNLDFAKGGAGKRKFADQERLLIEAKRRLEGEIRKRFKDSGTELDTNVYIRIAGYPNVSRGLWRARERYTDIYKIRAGCEENADMWTAAKALLRAGTKDKLDAKLLNSYLAKAEERHQEYQKAVAKEKKALQTSPWAAKLHDDILTGIARQRVSAKQEQKLLQFLKENEKKLESKGPDGAQLRFKYNVLKQDYIAHLPETYMSKISLDRIVAKQKDVDPALLIHAKLDQIRYLMVKLNHTENKGAIYRLWKLSKYEMRKLMVDDLGVGKGDTELDRTFKLLKSLKTASTESDAQALLAKEFGGVEAAKKTAQGHIDTIKKRIALTLKGWIVETRGIYAKTPKDPASSSGSPPSKK